MTVQEIIDTLKQNPVLTKKNSGELAKKLHADYADIITARKLFREQNLKPHNIIQKTFPKILFLDIETAPMQAYVWSRWKQNIYLDQTISEWFMISWSAKWLHHPEVMSEVLDSEEALAEDDSRITEGIWNLLNEADIVVAHNGKRFDIPKLNSRFILNGFNPPAPYKQIDTFEVANTQFGFSSNKLDALAGYFGIDHKNKTDFDLWRKCLYGDEEALVYMQEYNKKDVEILEEVYYRLRPWIKNHPNLALYVDSDSPVCPFCGGKHIEKEDKSFTYTPKGKYELFRCLDCGGTMRGGSNIVPKTQKPLLKTPAL